MSVGYHRLTRNPKTEKWQRAKWVPDHFGPGKPGVLFPSQAGYVNAVLARLETKNG